MGETRKGPLDGYRILELTTTVSGPMAAMTLADQGAEVLKIEPPFTGDTARFLGPARTVWRRCSPRSTATRNRCVSI